MIIGLKYLRAIWISENYTNVFNHINLLTF